MDTLVSQAKLFEALEKLQKELGELGVCIEGTLCQRSGKCSNPKCDCHEGVRKHLSWQLTQAEHGKTHTVYVPAEMVDQVREWTDNHRKAKKLIKEMSALCETYIRSFVPKRRAGIRLRQLQSQPGQEGEDNE